MRKQITAVVGVLALLAVAMVAGSWVTRADAGEGHKEVICHPNGSPAGYSKVDVDKRSSHFQDDGSPKHEHDGRVDVYSDSEGHCPGEPTPKPTPTVTETPTTEPPVTETPDPEPTETVTPGCPRVPAENEPCQPNETSTVTPVPNPDPGRPVRSSQCVGVDLVVTVEYPNGDVEHTQHPRWRGCFAAPADPRQGVGTPRRADAATVTVNEEGM